MSRIVLADVPFVKRYELCLELSSIDHDYWDSKIFLCVAEPMPAGPADFPAASGALYLFRRKRQPLGYLSAESTSPSEDAFIADTDSHFSAVEIFEEWNCIFA